MTPAGSFSFSQLGQRALPPTIGRLMTVALENPRLLSLAAGFTDNASLPVEPFARAVGALTARSGPPEYLQYGLNQGRPELRRQVVARLRQADGLLAGALDEKQVLVTNGSQQALYLAAQVLCDPGDIVLVERPTYFVFLEMLRGLGVEARSLPVDETGTLDFAALDIALKRWRAAGDLARIKSVYLVSYFSNPSGHTLGLAEKRGLARTLAAHGLVVPVIEDAAYRTLGFPGAPEVPSTLALEEWAPFPRLYAGTFTKPFATGLKVGFGYCTDDAWRDRMLNLKCNQDFGTANFNQAVIEQVLADGSYDAHLERLRRVYAGKMQALNGALETAGLRADGWRWAVPGGGLNLWLEAPRGWNLGLDSAFCRACVAAGVLYVPGELCFGDAPLAHTARLSFGVLSEAELRTAAQIFCGVARDHRG